MKLHEIKLKSIYYYVRPCPKCGSRCTGRFIKRPYVDSDFVEQESLKHGEIVRFASTVPEKNCFCVDCGFEFKYTVRTRLLTKDQILDEQRERGTEEAYEELKRENAAEDRAKRKKTGNRIINWIFSR